MPGGLSIIGILTPLVPTVTLWVWDSFLNCTGMETVKKALWFAPDCITNKYQNQTIPPVPHLRTYWLKVLLVQWPNWYEYECFSRENQAKTCLYRPYLFLYKIYLLLYYNSKPLKDLKQEHEIISEYTWEVDWLGDQWQLQTMRIQNWSTDLGKRRKATIGLTLHLLERMFGRRKVLGK